MALTIAYPQMSPNQKIMEFPFGPMKARYVSLTFDNSYPDEGEQLTAANLGWDAIYGFFPVGTINVAANTTGAVPHFEVASDYSSINIIAMVGGGDGAPMEEEAAATDLSSHILLGFVLGS